MVTNVMVCGSRDFTNYNLMRQKLDKILVNINQPITIVSGGARGADKLAERYAKDKGYGLIVIPAEWDKHGKGAGYIRNKQMVDISNYVIAFWDGKSKGTKHSIDIAKKQNKPIRVIRYK